MAKQLSAVLLVFTTALLAAAREPRLKWSYEALSNLYAPPIVADVHPHPGLETILSDSEARCVRCISATGTALWEFHGPWNKRMPSAVSVSHTARPERTTLIVGGSDGQVCALDGATGKRLWTRKLGGMTWGAIPWADLGGDGRDEAVVATEAMGVIALGAGGNALWTYGGPGTSDPLHVTCPPATVDIDGDGKDEIFVVDRWGPVCLRGDGTRRWHTRTGDQFVGAPVVSDADGDGAAELYCMTTDNSAVLRVDARNGAVAWVFPVRGPVDVYSGSAIAVGDLTGDGTEEIVVADSSGYVYALTATGQLMWMFPTEKRTHAAPSLGDVDGDGDVEVLVASGDRALYCLSSRGDLKWRFRAGLRLLSPATITDVDRDGKTDILFCGSDKTLRCLTLDGRYVEARVPWGTRRFDARQSGASFGKRGAAGNRLSTQRALLPHGGFDASPPVARRRGDPSVSNPQQQISRPPRGWQRLSTGGGTWSLDTTVKQSGTTSLKVFPGRAPSVICSTPMTAPAGMRSVSASLWAKGRPPVGTAQIRWFGRNGLLREDQMVPSGAQHNEQRGWVHLTLPSAVPPRGARWLTLVLTNAAGPAWWDSAEVIGTLAERPTLRAMVNQVGYDVGAPKRFTARSNFRAKTARFTVIKQSGAVVYEGRLQPSGRIHGAYGHDWGYYYWRGDFTSFDVPGVYRIRTTLDDATDTSWPLHIGNDLLWSATSRPAYRFFYYQRCGMAVPGFHGVCHRDDAVGQTSGKQYPLWGGWHDAGDYNTYHNAPYTFGLARSYGVGRQAFDGQDQDHNGQSDLLDEILWGGDHTRRMIAPDGSAYGPITSGYGFWGPPELETDNLPGTGDERPMDHDPDTGRDPRWHVVAMARIAKFAPDRQPYLEAAARGFKWRQDKGQEDLYQLIAALDLYAVSRQERYATVARKLFAKNGPARLATLSPYTSELSYCVDMIERYDALFGEDHREAVRAALVRHAEAMLARSDNPFGVITHGPPECPNFFGTPKETAGWHVGTSRFVSNAAAAMALAYRYAPNPRYLAFVYDQFNWTLGNNPFDLCLLEGRGSFNPPSYHHRYTFAGVPRGAVPGSIVNGITWRGAGDDRPSFDLSGLDIPAFESNEVWLPHNTAYINALVNLHRRHFHAEALRGR